MAEHTIKIDNGHLSFVYDDELGDLLDEGTVAVCRASHVEPHPVLKSGWVADMRPSGGPILGFESQFQPQSVLPMEHMSELELSMVQKCVVPFTTRAEALAAERAWLTKNKGL